MRLALYTRGASLQLGALLVLLLCSSLEGQENSFTINRIHMEVLPGGTVPNGQNLTLQCLVDISTTSYTQLPHQVLFFKDDTLFYNVTSKENIESFIIPLARVWDSGTYKCTVILNNKEKTSAEYQVMVQGVPNPRVTLDKKEAIEGGSVTVNCSVPEEKAPVHFLVEKIDHNTKIVKQRKEKTNWNQNFMTLEFPIEEREHLLVFQCQVSISVTSGSHKEISEFTRSDLVTVRESFSIPKFHISPQKDQITEGDELHIKCTIQVTPLAQVFPEIIIQKDKEIVASNKNGDEAVYSVMALVEHNGNYTCKVESRHISKVSSIMVNITELFAKPKLEYSSTRLDQGESLALSCFIPGAPPANFTILKEGTIISENQNFTKTAAQEDSGMYTCTASIGKVVKRSNAIWIVVCEMLSRPRISHNTKSEIIKGEHIEVSCQANGTFPISYQLWKANTILENYTKYSNDPAVFKDTPTKDVEYRCVVDNCHSQDKISSEIVKVKVIAPVEEVRLSILLNEVVETGKDMVLRCSVKEGTGPITYKFYKENQDQAFYQVTSNETQAFWRTDQASKKQEGQYYCTASNRASFAARAFQSNTLTVTVFLAPWQKGLIAVVVIGVIIASLIIGARCYFLRKAKGKQMPVEMSRPAVPLLNSNNEKVSDPNVEVNSHYGYSDDVGNHAMKPVNENKEPLNLDVEYTEVEVSSVDPHRALGTKGTETVYSEIRKANPDFVENRYSRTEGSLDGT
ncbi:platelet endothelial cell adhesion molecule [Ochotona princeps]|uniref:platelet endothelial cell adhesion molecule n=1 Tax=Ochotona princeps TaxID=9978 RepID=UPI0027155517|nr:platelet endothelial cell adhesion molecule [Ochotona princeps]